MGTFARILTYDEALSLQKALNTVSNAHLVEDGHFGELSKLALIRFKHDHDIVPEDDAPTLATTEALGIPPITTPGPAPAPRLTPNPLFQFFAGLALKAALNQLKGYFPMLNAISGYKTYAVGILSIAIGAADWIGWAIPNTATPSPAGWIVAGLIACFGRAGLAKTVEDIVSQLGPK